MKKSEIKNNSHHLNNGKLQIQKQQQAASSRNSLL
jgi:hypothetical protein